jgi:hypothetical protein
VTLTCSNWDEIGMTRSDDSGAFRLSPRFSAVEACRRSTGATESSRRFVGFASVLTPIDGWPFLVCIVCLFVVVARKGGDPVTTRLSTMSGCPLSRARHQDRNGFQAKGLMQSMFFFLKHATTTHLPYRYTARR